MSKWCTCRKCRKHCGGGKIVGKGTWYRHNPGGRRGARIAEAQGRRGTTSQRDRSSPMGEGVDPLNEVRQAPGSDSVRTILILSICCEHTELVKRVRRTELLCVTTHPSTEMGPVLHHRLLHVLNLPPSSIPSILTSSSVPSYSSFVSNPSSWLQL